MTRRIGILVMTASLSAGLSTGCLRNFFTTDRTPIKPPSETRPSEEQARLGPESSYHARPGREGDTPSGHAGIGEGNDKIEEVKAARFQQEQAVKAINPIDPPPELAKVKEPKVEAETPHVAEKTTGPLTLDAAPPDEPVITALKLLMEKKPAEALELVRQYDKSNQELLMHLLPLVVRLTQGSLEAATPTEVTLILDQLRGLERPLAPRAALSIGKMCFCRRQVDRFGDYEKLPDEHGFAAGSGGQPGEYVLVYVELKNFQSALSGGKYETRLQSSVEIRDFEGRLVWKIPFVRPPDRSQTARQDFFINYRFWVPPQLPPGSYTLWVQVKDVTGLNTAEPPEHRVARRSLDFRVIGTGSAASPRGGPRVAWQSGEPNHDRRIMEIRARKPGDP